MQRLSMVKKVLDMVERRLLCLACRVRTANLGMVTNAVQMLLRVIPKGLRSVERLCTIFVYQPSVPETEQAL